MNNFPFYRQLYSNDCGPNCIKMICAYYKNKYSLATIKEYCGTTRIGTTLLDIQNCVNKLGFNSAAIKISLGKINEMPLPAILFWKQDHFIVLYKITKRKGNTIYHVADPGFGKVKLQEEIFQKAFIGDNNVGVAVVLEPTVQFYETKDVKPSVFEHLQILYQIVQSSILKHKSKFYIAIILSLVAMVANWIIPIIFQHVIDDGIGSKNLDLIHILALCQFILFLSYIISGSFSNILLSKVGYSLGISFLSGYLNKLIKLPIRFFDTKVTSDLIQLVDDQDNLKSFFTYQTITIIFAVSNIIVFSTILIYYNFWVFILFSIFALLCGLWFSLFFKKRKIINYLRFAVSSEAKNNIYELVMGMREIKINSAQKTKVSQIENTQNKINKYHLKDLYLNLYNNLGISSLNKLKDIIIIIICARLVIDDQMSMGVLMTISYLLGQLSEPFNQLLNLTREFQNAKYSLERLTEIQKAAEENNQFKIISPARLSLGFSLKNVSFKYAGSYSPFVINNIDFDIPKGNVTAIVGPSGSGKTTLLKLLLAFYYPQKGDIFLDNQKMSDYNSDEWRKQCGVVMQDGFMFSGTIMENIAIADENPDLDKVRKAAKIACIDDFIDRLPMQYNSKIGNSGIDLSGGQKQRLLIARAVYKDPEFIFFDEATSFLDTTNEAAIMQNLKDFYKEKTVVIIAHRLSTVKEADNIIVLDNGVLIEKGTHAKLIKSKGYYYHLIKNQLELEN